MESILSMGEGQKQAPQKGGGGGGQAPPAGGGQTPEGPETDRLATLRKEISDIAKDLRLAFVPIVPKGANALQCERNVQASSAYKSGGGSSSRLCYICAVPLSWELPRIRGVKKLRATPLLDDDFAAFADTTSRLITAENEAYAVVMMGKLADKGLACSVRLVSPCSCPW